MRKEKREQKLHIRLLAVLAACVMSVCTITGCSSSSGKGSEEAPAAAEQEASETEKEQETPSGQEAQGTPAEQETPVENESATRQEAQGTPAEQETPAGYESSTEQEAQAVGEQEAQAVGEQEAQKESLEPLTLLLPKIGRADNMVLMCGGSTMVIDCAKEENGEEILEYLAQKGVEQIDILIITHFDDDHMGGAGTVLEGIPVKRILVPAYEGSGKRYNRLMEAAKSIGIGPERLSADIEFRLGDALVTVEPPASYEIPDSGEDYDNNFSLITTVVLGENRLVFTGDIEEERISQWLESGKVKKCDVLKIPHHGLYNEPLEELVGVMQPSYAVICDSEKSPAGERTVSMLEENGAQCLQTKDGEITIVCDGENIEADQ